MKELTIAPRVGTRYLQLLEETIGEPLPNSMKILLLKYSGLEVLENIYIDSDRTVWEIQTFDYIASMIDLTKEFIENGWGKILPFAYDPGGWHYCLSFELDTYGKILVNRWTDYPPEEQFLVIANTLESFVNSLEERGNHI